MLTGDIPDAILKDGSNMYGFISVALAGYFR